MSAVPDAVSLRMRQVLEGVVEAVSFGSGVLVKKHVWRNETYVGMFQNKVAAWQGWNANLAKVDPRYRTIYIDLAENDNGYDENTKLFGAVFSNTIMHIQPFIFMFVTSCSIKHCHIVADHGFSFRQINEVIHPGVVMSVSELLETPLEVLIKRGTELVDLQRHLLD